MPAGFLESESTGSAANESPDASALETPIRVVSLISPSQLIVASAEEDARPFTNAAGLEALDALVIAGGYAMQPSEAAALRNWVNLGGHLILSVGRNLEEYQTSPLSAWVSGESGPDSEAAFRITGVTEYRDLSAMETFSGKNEPLIINRQNPLPGVKIETTETAQVLVSVRSGPLIVRAPYGLGTVTMVGVDLDRNPIQSWPALPLTMRKLLLHQKHREEKRRPSANNQLAYSGITEFATQIQTALLRFPTVNRLSTWAIIGMLFAYLLAIGPLDYFLVHHVFKRPRLTWVTFPVCVVAAAVFCVWSARSHNGDTLIANQLDVLDLDASTNTLRARSWVSIYSPETRRYQITLRPSEQLSTTFSSQNQNSPPLVRTAWAGVPEATFGGMYRTGGVQMTRAMYQFAPGAAGIDNLPIPLWGAKSLTGEWFSQNAPLVVSRLESLGAGRLRGTIEHHLPVPITDWFLAYNSRVFRPRTNLVTGEEAPLPPGRAWPAGETDWSRINQREITGYLTRTVAREIERKGSESKTKDFQQPKIRMEQEAYDPLAEANPDPLADILRILTFYRRVGGKDYTGLDNHTLRDMDFSDRLDLNRAVLFGRLDLPATNLSIKDQTPNENQHAAFIRIVLPVKQVAKAPETPLKLER